MAQPADQVLLWLLASPALLYLLYRVAQAAFLLQGRAKGQVLRAYADTGLALFGPQLPLANLLLPVGGLLLVLMLPVSGETLSGALLLLYLGGGLTLTAIALMLQPEVCLRRWPWLARWPRWYAELITFAAPPDLAHLAGCWRELPEGTRAQLDGDEASFSAWADLVVLSAVQ